MANEVSYIIASNGEQYEIVDRVARESAAAGFALKVVTVLPEASVTTKGAIYLVPHDPDSEEKENYDEYVTVEQGGVYSWEKIGSTAVDLSGYSKKNHIHSVTSNVTVGNHNYTPEGTNQSSSVTFGEHSTDNFVKSYNGEKKKLETATISKVTDNSDVTIPNITSVGSVGTAAAMTVSVTNGVLEFSFTPNVPTTVPTLGDALTASKVTTTTQTVATGSLADSSSTSNVGGEIMVGMGTPTTAAALTSLGAATAEAQIFNGTAATLTHNVTNNTVNSGTDFNPQ